jgi:hypothetical protein
MTQPKDADEGLNPINCSTSRKPLGRKSYGSIGHLPNSRLGPSDSCVTEGQAKICTSKARDNHDTIIVQEKLDGSNVGVVLLNGEIVPMSRAGYHARTSPFEQHHLFADWVLDNEHRFRKVLNEGERICGEWLAQAHGTKYFGIGNPSPPFMAFDIMRDTERKIFKEFADIIEGVFAMPHLISVGPPISVDRAMEIHQTRCYPCDEIEGVVYRVERHGKVDFLAKYVRPDKVDGKYLESVTGKPVVWNWRP